MAAFHFASSEEPSARSTPAHDFSPSDPDLDDFDSLPYPGELPRSDFLAADFDPQLYLSTLRNRHQTLEDLRTDLRQRSQLLNRELLDLVNGNYEEFLSLGGDLKGGEEKVEGVRLGLLGFEREVEGLRKVVRERSDEVGRLLQERRQLRNDAVLGRALLEADAQLTELEERLGIRELDDADGDSYDLDDYDDDASAGTAPQMPTVRRLRRHCDHYTLLQRDFDRLGRTHPFVLEQQPRMDEVRKTLLLDLATETRNAKKTKKPDAVLEIAVMFHDLGAEGSGVAALTNG